MKEIICVHIGQAGIQLGSAVWELICAEHGVNVNGQSGKKEASTDDGGKSRFFFETKENQSVPRCLMVDLEPSVVDEIRSGSYKELFSHESLMSGYEDSASIFSRGYFSFGRFFINEIMIKMNRLLELCDTPQAFIFTHSSGGGTGSGLFSLMVEEMEEFSKVMKLDMCLHPSFPISPIIVEPYNSVLTSHYTMDNTDITFLMDNEALYNLAFKHLEQVQMNYHLINRISCQVISSVTAATRFDGQSTTITEYLHNLVPYPRIHFPICSLAPVASPHKQAHTPNSIYTITKDALSHEYQMIRCIPMDGKFMSCCFMYRGDVSPGEVYQSIERLKCYDRMQFVDWSPTGIKITVCNRPSTIVASSGLSYSTRSLAILCNNSAIVDALLQNTFRFHILFKKRAFIHWYVGEGMEEEEFKDSLENIACLVKDYEECAYPTKLLQQPSVGDTGEGGNESPKEVAPNTLAGFAPSDPRHKREHVQNSDAEEEEYSIQEINENNAVDVNVNKKISEAYFSEDISRVSSFVTTKSVQNAKDTDDDLEPTNRDNSRNSTLNQSDNCEAEMDEQSIDELSISDSDHELSSKSEIFLT